MDDEIFFLTILRMTRERNTEGDMNVNARTTGIYVYHTYQLFKRRHLVRDVASNVINSGVSEIPADVPGNVTECRVSQAFGTVRLNSQAQVLRA